MPQQVETLVHMRRLLAADIQVLVCVPTVTSGVFEIFRENWVNLDAHRHFFLHSHGSLEIAASKAGIVITRLWIDSSALQFIASELCIKYVSLTDPRSVEVNKSKAIFTMAHRRDCGQRTAKLSRTWRGDMNCAV